MIKLLSSYCINKIILVNLGILCLFFIQNSQSIQLKKISEKTFTKNIYLKQEESDKLKLSFLRKISAFGYDNLIADWGVLQFLQYFGDDEARNVTGYSLSADYLELVAQNDPLFSRAYMVISPVSSMFAGTPERTIAIMNKGLSQMSATTPDAYYVWLYKGMDEILFLGDLQAAENSYLMSAEWASIARDQKIAKSARDTAKFLATKPDTKQAQVGVWFMVWNNTQDQRIRQIAQAKIESIGGELKIYPDGRVEAIPPKISNS
jgi:hypothetical protein